MGTFKSIEEAREYFKDEKFAAANGMQIDELDETSCTCSVVIREDHRNAFGGVMGGVTFTLADFAMAVITNQIHHLSVAQQISINYLSVPKGEMLTARAKCIKDGRRTSIVNVDVEDETGRYIAKVIGTSFKV